MCFSIVTDTSANLPAAFLRVHQITVVPFSYYIGEREYLVQDSEEFDSSGFYAMLKEQNVTTSLIGVQRYLDFFTPILERGEDLLYLGMSSGISGAVQAATLAADLLKEQYPAQKALVLDTLAASLGEGLLVMAAAALRDTGSDIETVMQALLKKRLRICQYFTVDDLLYLRRGGRIPNLPAMVGTVLNLKPVLKGDNDGRIQFCGKARGRKRALCALADHLEKEICSMDQIVCIAHGDCPEDAAALAAMIRERYTPKEIIIMCYEPVTGVHAGPGALALFFEGNAR